jgi:hypothetical protein
MHRALLTLVIHSRSCLFAVIVGNRHHLGLPIISDHVWP